MPDDNSERNNEDEGEPENETFDPNEQKEYTNKFEHRTVENVEFIEMLRSGRICSNNITE